MKNLIDANTANAAQHCWLAWAFPKLLAMLLAEKSKLTETLPNASKFQAAKLNLAVFPYCTAYQLTG
ncbi:hypothetical protein FM036_41675, partial [Nostoc sp. HG1]|nr:hypothetical protein [Nostoc sp. HG1]